jgi:hypothetical protein
MGLSQTRYSLSSKLLLMQPKTGEFLSEPLTLETQEKTPKTFKLYEEYSQRDIFETVKTRRSKYEKATRERRKELEGEVEVEVKNFCRWLVESKKLEPSTAHYYAIALKGLLLGLPTGVQVAQLFNTVLDNL